MVIDSRLEEDSVHIKDLDLCRVFLKNNALFPWLILVPLQENLTEITDLSEYDRQVLMNEICKISDLAEEIFNPDKMNIAALGNIVSQLHIHVIARYKTDSAWPNPVWERGSKSYESKELKELVDKIQENL